MMSTLPREVTRAVCQLKKPGATLGVLFLRRMVCRRRKTCIRLAHVGHMCPIHIPLIPIPSGLGHFAVEHS